MLWTLLLLLAALTLWAIFGRLDIVAVADGKLIPETYVKIVQPTEAGVVKEILVGKGQAVKAGQVLMRMDNSLLTEADARAVDADHARKRVNLRRIDAELGGQAFRGEAGDPPTLVREVEVQMRANRAALAAALAEERARLARATQDLAAAEAVRRKLVDTLPHYQAQEKAFARLTRDGFAGDLMASDKARERIEKEQELKTQEHVIASAQAGVVQSERRLAQIEADDRRRLLAERNDLQAQVDRLAEETTKLAHRRVLTELKATQDGVIKELATHTTGTVVQPGTVLATLVPKDEILRAEVWVSNEDIGFVRRGQPVKLKFEAFPFQKYGMADGVVAHVGAAAADADAGPGERGGKPPLVYKALVTLDSMRLEAPGERLGLAPGMRTAAEIRLGTRSVLEYLLSPVQKAWHEAARER